MKRIYVLITVFILIFIFSTPHLKAQFKEKNLFINIGILTDDSLDFKPFRWNAGANLDIHLSQKLKLSPECNVIFEKFSFKYIWLEPGILLNLKINSYFVGAGASKWYKLAGKFAANSDLFLKVNAGYEGVKYRLNVYALTPFNNAFARYQIIFGATIGIRF